jgi:hypothetical protein
VQRRKEPADLVLVYMLIKLASSRRVLKAQALPPISYNTGHQHPREAWATASWEWR